MKTISAHSNVGTTFGLSDERPALSRSRYATRRGTIVLCAAVILGATYPLSTAGAGGSANEGRPHDVATPIGNGDIEADVSTKSIAITSGFSGTQIIVFGAVNHPYKVAPLNQKHDVIVSVEGLPKPLIARRKSNILGLWVNTNAMRFDSAPSYYAVAATRPILEITTRPILKTHKIGIENLNIYPSGTSSPHQSHDTIADYKDAVIRLKRAAKLYQSREHGVEFKGRSLFRSQFKLPANVPVGPLKASVYLFRKGKLVSRFTSRVELRREGLQRYLYDLAYNHATLYGALAVIFAIIAGLSASAVFGRKTH